MENTGISHNSKPAIRFQIAEIALAFVGVLIASTVYIADRANVDLPCTAGGGCSAVASSEWANFPPGAAVHVPVALVGAISYFLVLSLVMLRMGVDGPRIAKSVLIVQCILVALGTAYSLYLQYIAHFVLGEFCVWCFSSACVITLLCIVTAVDLLSNAANDSGESTQSVQS